MPGHYGMMEAKGIHTKGKKMAKKAADKKKKKKCL
jgi:hypothetical protein